MWANLASVVCAIGLGSLAGIGRVFDIDCIRRRSGLHLLVIAAMAAIVAADLSQLSKAETERIWLPFTVWLTAAPALLPIRSQRWWLAVNIVGALAVEQLHLHELVAEWVYPPAMTTRRQHIFVAGCVVLALAGCAQHSHEAGWLIDSGPQRVSVPSGVPTEGARPSSRRAFSLRPNPAVRQRNPARWRDIS